MSTNTINPSIEQGALQNFQDSFHKLAQQTKSRLVAGGAVKFLPSKGKTNNLSRMGRVELVQVDTRNPDKQVTDYALDNRQFTKNRFTRTIQIDMKHDVNELLKDPTSDLLSQLDAAKERVIDRIIVKSAIGPVLTGAADQAPTSTSAAADGVRTIDATSGFVYTTIQAVTQDYINSELQNQFAGAIIGATGKENTSLMAETNFIRNDYITTAVAENGIAEKVGGYRVELFAGSVNGGIQVDNPILPEVGAVRTCVVLAPNSIALSMEVGLVSVMPSPTKVNSQDITIDFWINGMRIEGPLVKLITTTI